MIFARALSLGVQISFAMASVASMAQSGSAASAPERLGESSGGGKIVGPSHRLVVVPAATTMVTDFAKGCWVRLYDGKNYLGEELVLVGPLRLDAMGTTSPWWRLWNSVIVGPKARVTIYGNPNYRGRSAALSAEQRWADLGGKEPGWSGKIESAQVDCSVP